MKFKTHLLITVLLIAGCQTAPSDVEGKADRLTVPAVKEYTPEQYKQATKEHAAACLPDEAGRIQFPMLCTLVDDFGRMRDAARVALGLKVNLTR